MKIILVDAVNTFILKEIGVFEEMYDLLQKYSNKKIVVTNATPEKIVDFGIDKIPYEYFSLNNNPNKSDPKYFELLLKKYAVETSDVVYFEHNFDAVISARSLGIRSYHYNSAQRDLKSLQVFLEDNIS